MHPETLLGEFCAAGTDSEPLALYLDRLAHEDARTRLGHTRLEQEALLHDIARLQREKAALEDEVALLHAAKLEHLVAFLPVFFRHFWTEIRPDELAMMCGRIDIPFVTAPYIEPGPDTVRFMRRRFLQLDAADRERILAFCHDLEHRLQIRAEMRSLMWPVQS